MIRQFVKVFRITVIVDEGERRGAGWRFISKALEKNAKHRDEAAKITIDGRPVPESLDLRQGVVRRDNGVNALVIWMELTSLEPVTMTIQ